MADSVTLTTVVEGITKTATLSLSPAEAVILKQSIAPAAADVDLALGGLTAPKAIVVFGGVGISVRMVLAATVISANPFCAICCEPGFAQAKVLVSNSGSQPVTVTVLAIE